jgi:hypothetical protein
MLVIKGEAALNYYFSEEIVNISRLTFSRKSHISSLKQNLPVWQLTTCDLPPVRYAPSHIRRSIATVRPASRVSPVTFSIRASVEKI